MNTNALLETAKQCLQNGGGCRPIVAVEFADDGQGPLWATAELPGFPESLDLQRMLLHGTGHKIAKAYPDRRVKEAALFVQTWAVKAEVGAISSVPPSQHPDRIEILVMQVAEVIKESQAEDGKPMLKETEYAAEILRSGAGIDFLPLDEKIGVDILPDFFLGIACEKASAEEAEPAKKTRQSKKDKKKAKKGTEKAGKQ